MDGPPVVIDVLDCLGIFTAGAGQHQDGGHDNKLKESVPHDLIEICNICKYTKKWQSLYS
jgi:hypothetical protein